MPPAPVPLHDDACAPAVRGTLHACDGEGGDGVVLAHGAGGDQHAPVLVALATAFADRGITALRCDLPFRQARPSGPPGATSAARDRAGLARALDVLGERLAGRLFAGGHSYGGRQASLLAAEKPSRIAGLLLTSYPLHPPGRPDAPRTAHLPELRAPVLFVHGARDAFATLDELTEASRAIASPTSILSVPGAGHELVRARSAAEVARATVEAFLALIG